MFRHIAKLLSPLTTRFWFPLFDFKQFWGCEEYANSCKLPLRTLYDHGIFGHISALCTEMLDFFFILLA